MKSDIENGLDADPDPEAGEAKQDWKQKIGAYLGKGRDLLVEAAAGQLEIAISTRSIMPPEVDLYIAPGNLAAYVQKLHPEAQLEFPDPLERQQLINEARNERVPIWDYFFPIINPGQIRSDLAGAIKTYRAAWDDIARRISEDLERCRQDISKHTQLVDKLNLQIQVTEEVYKQVPVPESPPHEPDSGWITGWQQQLTADQPESRDQLPLVTDWLLKNVDSQLRTAAIWRYALEAAQELLTSPEMQKKEDVQEKWRNLQNKYRQLKPQLPDTLQQEATSLFAPDELQAEHLEQVVTAAKAHHELLLTKQTRLRGLQTALAQEADGGEAAALAEPSPSELGNWMTDFLAARRREKAGFEKTLELRQEQLAVRTEDRQRLDNASRAALPEIESSFNEALNLITTPTTTSITAQFVADVDQLKAHCLKRTAVGTRLAKFSFRQRGSEQILEADNPITLINPAELQEQDQLPFPYRPPEASILHQLKESVRQAGMWQTIRSLRQAAPPNAEVWHLQAKKMTESEAGIGTALFGVYYIKFIFVLDEMLVLYSLYYDFIRGEIIEEKAIEAYYEDIVALEYGETYRTLTQYTHDSVTETKIKLPFFSLVLPNGISYTTVIANNSYLQYALAQDQTYTGLPFDSHQIEQSQVEAAAAVHALRSRLRDHKALLP